ncbi:DUF3592 domain-containing protein [Nocardiopsis changdeensis]|uniref:PASTA domain-containing protein n=1 Tax=Nocardiopsis changdeensis TaxID=2831969 RepID=A0ABX8BFQ2_9ACTN|nr:MULTISPECIES: DUF3592 domain-containing protein [Nocardiopsis]QUX21065.1 hypothetical protein KGD84_21780 [Nocardiopsis changdeensis]QYX36995.1 hypothetical protein K1J57_31235 [Nocardiopsis sp. MT53]
MSVVRTVLRLVFAVEVLIGLGLLGGYLWLGLNAPAGGFPSPWESYLGMAIGGGVVLLTSLFTLRIESSLRGLGGAKAMAGAPIAVGTVTDWRRTGLTVNDAPQIAVTLDVETPEGHRFTAVAKELLDPAEVGLLEPGVLLPVRYRPDRPGVVAIDRSGDQAAAQAAFDAVMLRAGLTTPRALEIAAHGIPAQGVITEVRPTGNLVNGNPEMDVEVAVTRPDGGVFHTRTVKRLPARLSTSLQVGRVVTVHYLPGQEDEITIQTPANPGVH